MTALADGSDFGGSLRAPAAWCNVAGLRPSPGRVPSHPTKLPWTPLSVHGPMARSVADLALFLSAIAGPDGRAPLSIEQSASLFAAPLARNFSGVWVAWSANLGYLPIDAEIAKVCAAAKFAVERHEEIQAHRDRSRCPAGLPPRDCRWACRSPAAIMRISRCCNSVMPSNRRRSAGAAGRRCKDLWRLFKFPSHHSDKRCMSTIVPDNRLAFPPSLAVSAAAAE